MRAWEINVTTGMFVADVPNISSEDIHPCHITVAPPAGLRWPRWDGNAWVEGGDPPTNEQIIKALTAELEKHYDTAAQTHRYDNRFTCALRAGYAGPFQAEGTAFAIWMDTCNAHAYEVMAAVLAGNRNVPTAEELISEMPVLVWPV